MSNSATRNKEDANEYLFLTETTIDGDNSIDNNITLKCISVNLYFRSFHSNIEQSENKRIWGT